MPAKAGFKRIALLGLGLIGGSIALAVRETFDQQALVGFDPAPASLQWAKSHRIDMAPDLAAAVADADLVILATPLAALHDLLEALTPAFHPQALMIDVASTKTTPLQLAGAWLGDAIERFVPCHPIAGGEQSGPLYARADLFLDRPVILTPDDRSLRSAVERVDSFWQALGAKTVEMSAPAHDRLFGYLSHAPHLLAFAYMAEAGALGFSREEMALAGPGFRDFTRIAGGNPELWADILIDNRALVGALLDRQRKRLQVLGDLLSEADREELIAALTEARDLRVGLG